MDLALDNSERLICHGTKKPTSPNYYNYYKFEFSTPALADCFPLESKWQYVFRTLLGILNNAVAMMDSICPLMSKSFSPFTYHTRAPITIDMTVTSMFLRFFKVTYEMYMYFSLFLISFNFTLCSTRTAKFTNRQFLFTFCFFSLSQGLVVWPRLGDLFVSQNTGEVYVSYSPGRILGCAYTIYWYGQNEISFQIPCRSPTPPSKLSLIIQSFCANLLHSLIMRLITLFVSVHSQ